jgi:hypothetical protein
VEAPVAGQKHPQMERVRVVSACAPGFTMTAPVRAHIPSKQAIPRLPTHHSAAATLAPPFTYSDTAYAQASLFLLSPARLPNHLLEDSALVRRRPKHRIKLKLALPLAGGVLYTQRAL